MKNFGKRITGFLLAFIMAFDFSVPTFSMELLEVPEEAIETEPEYIEEEMEPDELSTYAVDPEKSLEETVREQVEAYAKSIDQKDADGAAADKLVAHGIAKGGKKLSVGKSHPLTATLFNSGLLKECLTDSLAKIIETARRLNEKNMYGFGESNWKLSGDYSFHCYIHDYNSEAFDYGKHVSGLNSGIYTGKRNAYDSSLEWMAGATMVDISLELKKITKTEVTYKVTCKVLDRFDFDTASGLLSSFAALLFEEFDWESTVSFNLKVPYSCNHSTENFGWTYDSKNLAMNSVLSEGFVINEAKKKEIVNDNGTKVCFYELAEAVNLFHDKPWVMEYTVMNPNYFTLAPAIREQYSYPFLCNMGKNYIFFQDYETVDGKRINNCYGISFDGAIPKDTLYTVKLENVISGNENMIYVSVFNETSGKYLYENVPMDDHYYLEGGVLNFKNGESDKISGKDFIINYIGNKQYSFFADYFDLRIWENGKDSESASCFEKGKTTKPTCTEKGYTTYTCSLCGYSYKDNYTAALGHSFGEWETVTAPTAENPGEEKRFCSACEYSETRVVPAIGCTLADANLDGAVNVMDAYFVRLIVAKIVEPTAKQIEMCDVDLDGKITAIDANIIRKYAVGIIKNLPTE